MSILRRIKGIVLAFSVAVMALAAWAGPTRASASAACPDLLNGTTASASVIDITSVCGGGGNNPPPPPPCYEASCTGLDPQTTGCGPDQYTYTVDSVGPGTNTPYLELRVSPTCGAAWARITNCANCNERTIFAQGATCRTNTCGIAVTETGNDAFAGQQSWSPMISYTYFVRACTDDAQYPQGYPTICTAWH